MTPSRVRESDTASSSVSVAGNFIPVPFAFVRESESPGHFFWMTVLVMDDLWLSGGDDALVARLKSNELRSEAYFNSSTGSPDPRALKTA